MAKSKKRGKPRAGSGRFKRLANKIKEQYVKKGMSAKKASEIANAIAAKTGFKKYGKKAMLKEAAKGRRKKRKRK